MPKKKGATSDVPDDLALYQTEEGRNKLQQQNMVKLKEKQLEEDRISKMNHYKLQIRWREILRQEKTQKLMQEVEILQRNHQRQLDHKDAAVERRDKDLEEAEHQFQTALQSHLINIDNLISVQTARLDAAHNQFQTELNTLESEFDTEKQNLQTTHQKEKLDLQRTIARMEQEFQEAEAEAKHEYQSMRDDVKNKNLEEKHALRIQLEGTLDDLWRQFQRALDDYNQSTEERKSQFEALKEKDLESAKVIEHQMKRLTKLQEIITHLKTKLANNTRDFDDRNKALRDEKEALQNHFQDLKRKMNLYRDNERKKLTELTVLSNRVVRQLKDRVEVAENILKLTEMNGKLESEEEHVHRFQPTDLDEETKKAIKEEEERIKASVDIDVLPSSERTALQQFFKRYNKVLLDKYALDTHKGALQRENDHLKAVLKDYLEGISVSEEILAKKNPLLVVNGKTNVVLKPQVTDHGPVCIDGPQLLTAQRGPQ